MAWGRSNISGGSPEAWLLENTEKTKEMLGIDDIEQAVSDTSESLEAVQETANSALSKAEEAKESVAGMQADSYDITLTTAGWAANTTYSGYGYRYAYALSGVTDKSIASVTLDANSVKVAAEAGMLSACETVAGYVYFYSAKVPTSNLTGTLMCSIELPFESVVEGFNPDEYATKDEVNAAIAAIPTPDVSGQINEHNSSTAAHADIRAEIAGKAPAYTYGTTDLTAGTSPLETGKLYFVYEGGGHGSTAPEIPS